MHCYVEGVFLTVERVVLTVVLIVERVVLTVVLTVYGGVLC